MIPLSVPNIAGNEWQYVKECLDTGWISSAGTYVSRFEEAVAGFAGAKYGVACMNGTAGLHIAQELCGIGRGDYVIVPNITFIATLNAIKYTGADPILIDVDADDWQMDLDLLEIFLTTKTETRNGQRVLKENGRPIKAIMPVHVLGNMCDMDRLMSIATQYKLEVIEDSTESLGSFFNGKHSGTFGKLGVFSFNGNKIISTGGGGVIVTDDEKLAKKAKHLTTQAKISPDEYIHDSIGYNYRLVNVLAAIGVAQMEQLPQFVERKKQIDFFYRQELNGVEDICFQKVAPQVDPNCWLFTFKTKKMRSLLRYLNENGVQSRPFWMPMNQLPMFKNDIYISENDVSDTVYKTAISIPSSTNLTAEQLELVAGTIRKFFNHSRATAPQPAQRFGDDRG